MAIVLRLLLLCGVVLCGTLGTRAEKPNVIVIFTDDQGYGDLGVYGAEGFSTPEIDRMASEGIRFTNFHVVFPSCTMSRMGLLTGRYPYRWGKMGGVYFPWSRDGLPQSEVTIAEILKEQGYATSIVGKWHLGHLPEFLPTEQGFDSYFGIPYSNDMAHDGGMPLAPNAKLLGGMTLEDYHAYLPQEVGKDEGRELYRKYKDKVPLMENTEVIEWPVDQTQITRRFTERAIDFIDENADRPFFLYLAHSMPHVPLFVSDTFEERTERGLYGDVIEEIDWSVGQVLEALRERGLDQNTLVVFTSDNGPWLAQGDTGGSAGSLRDGKGTTYEGGQRVPSIFWWPGRIPAGVVSDFDGSTLDILPTVAALAGAELPTDRVIDGLDIRPVLLGNESEAPSREFFIYGGGQGISKDGWKYRKGRLHGTWIRKQKGAENPQVEQLFNLEEDLGEQTNVIEQYPEKAKTLKQLLQREMAAMNPNSN
ncbi:MAG: sulfatase [Verrucomicrobiota bacterium]